MTTVDAYLLECVARFNGDFQKVSAAFMHLANTIDGGKWRDKAKDHFNATALRKKHELLTGGSKKSAEPVKVDRFASLLDKLPKMDFSPSDSSEEGDNSPSRFQMPVISGLGFGGVPIPMRAADPYGRTAGARRAAEERRETLGIGGESDEDESDEDDAKFLREEVRKNYGPSVWSPRKGVPFYFPDDEAASEEENAATFPEHESSETDTPAAVASPAVTAFVPPQRPATMRIGGTSVLAGTAAGRRGLVDPFSPDFDVTVHLTAEERAFFAAECERRRQAMGSRMNFGLIKEPMTAPIPVNADDTVEMLATDEEAKQVTEEADVQEESDCDVSLGNQENAEVEETTDVNGGVAREIEHLRTCRDDDEFGGCWSFGMSTKPSEAEIDELLEALKRDDLVALQLYRGRVYVGVTDTNLKRPRVVADEIVLKERLQRQRAFTSDHLRVEDGSSVGVVCLLENAAVKAMKPLMQMARAAGLYVSGLRVAFVTEATASTTPTSSLLAAVKKTTTGRLTLVCFRGPRAAESLRDIVGPSDPKLAASTDPDSLNARMGQTVAYPPPVTANMSLAEAMWGWSNSSLSGGLSLFEASETLEVLPRQTVSVTLGISVKSEDTRKFATTLATMVQRCGNELVSVGEEAKDVFRAVVVREACSGEEAKQEILQTLGMSEVATAGVETGDGCGVGELSETPVKDVPEVAVVAILHQAAWTRMGSCVDVLEDLLTRQLPQVDILSVKAIGSVRMGVERLCESLSLGFRRGHGATRSKIEGKTVILVSLRGFELLSKIRKLAAQSWRHPAFVGGDVYFTESHAAALQVHRLFLSRVSGDPVRLGEESKKFLLSNAERRNWFGECKAKQTVRVTSSSVEMFARVVHRLGSLDLVAASTDVGTGKTKATFRGAFALRKAESLSGSVEVVMKMDDVEIENADESEGHGWTRLTADDQDVTSVCEMLEIVDKENVKMRGFWLNQSTRRGILAVDISQTAIAKQLLQTLGWQILSSN